MPCGSSRTGRKIPKMPGSIRYDEQKTGTSASSVMREEARIEARIRNHPRIHENITKRKPHSQAASRITGHRLPSREAASGVALAKETAAGGATCEKGKVICSIAAAATAFESVWRTPSEAILWQR